MEDRSDKAKREADKFRLNLKYRAGEEKGFARKLVSMRHRGRGVGGRKSGVGGFYPGPLSWYDISGQWTEGEKRVLFCVNYSPWSWYRCLPWGGAQRNGSQDGTEFSN